MPRRHWRRSARRARTISDNKAIWQREREEAQRQVNRLREEVRELRSAEAQQAQKEKLQQAQRLASENVKASLEKIRKKSQEDKAVWQREREEMQRQVKRLQEEVLAAANAKASLEEIRVQQNDHMNKLLNSEKMRTKQVTPELDAERLGKEDALQQHAGEQTKNCATRRSKQTRR